MNVSKSLFGTAGARLALCALFGRVLRKGLGLLGIETPEHI